MLQNQWKNIKSIKNIIPKPSNVTKQIEKHKKHKKHNFQTIRILAAACGHGLEIKFFMLFMLFH